MLKEIILEIKKEKKDKTKDKVKPTNPNKPTKLHNRHIPNRPLTNDILNKFRHLH